MSVLPITQAGWTLLQMQQKLRSVVGMLSDDQISDSTLTAYLNDYLVYTMPHELKVQIQNKFLTFKTLPGQNVYEFPGAFLTDSPGAYADGFPLIFYESPDIFYQDWPQQYSVDQVATGDGSTAGFAGNTQAFPIINETFFITDGLQVLQDSGEATASVTLATANGGTSYSGTVSAIPIEPGSFTALGGIGSLTAESFVDNGAGILTGSQGGSGTINYTSGAWTLLFNSAVTTGLLITSTYEVVGLNVLIGDGSGTLNTLTGAFSIGFTSAPASTIVVYDKYIAYQGNRPQGVMFFDNEFTFMPVPDQVYQIQMQGFVLPALLVNDTDTPAQAEWGPLIVYGAALEIFSDRGDLENYNRYYQVFKRYESVALSRTIQQLQPMQGVPRF